MMELTIEWLIGFTFMFFTCVVPAVIILLFVFLSYNHWTEKVFS